MGDVTNLAARLESLNKAYGTGLMVSENTWRAARDRVVARPVDVVAVKGKSRGVRVYELLALVGKDDGAARALADLCEKALDAYLSRDFAAARESYREVLVLRPEDSVAKVLLERCERYLADPPPDDWNGVHVAREK